jgi:6-phosphogluconolactonase
MSSAASPANSSLTGTSYIFVGSYTTDPAHGISLLKFDDETGHMENLGVSATSPNPSFLAIDPTGEFLYAIHDRNPGKVAAYCFDAKSAKLSLLNIQETGSPGPTHLCLDAERKNLIVANYAGGSVTCLPINEDGSLATASAFVQHQGSSADPKRQEAPHAHGVYMSPDNRFVLCTDLGTDKIYVYKFDPVLGSLEPNDPPHASVKAGAGVRHGTFSPDGTRFYVINELDNTITGFNWDADRGVLQEFAVVSTLPEGAGPSQTAEIEFHPSGRFLYGSNRGHDSIAIFAVDPTTGRLTSQGHAMTGAPEPRHFQIHPSGKWILAGNQKASTVTLFKLDETSGQLIAHGPPFPVNQPVCLIHLPIRR